VFSKTKAGQLAEHRPYDLKSPWMQEQPHPLAPSTPYPRRNLQLFVSHDENLATGFIRPSHSPCGALVLFIRKKMASLQLCVDFLRPQPISRMIITRSHYLQSIGLHPRKARIYTKINLRTCPIWYGVPPGTNGRPPFWTRYGSFEWLVMPERLTNAPAVFRFMNTSSWI